MTSDSGADSKPTHRVAISFRRSNLLHTRLEGDFDLATSTIRFLLLPRRGRGSADWISQLYFEGDQYNATDPIGGASLPEAKSRIIPLSKDAAGTLQGVFDIVLPSLPAADRSARFSLQGHDLAIQRFHRMVRFFVPEELYGGILGVYSPTGMTLREWEIVDPFIQWKTDDVPRGTYLARLISHQEIEQAVHFQL